MARWTMRDNEERHIDPRDIIQRKLAGREWPDWKIALICFRPYRDSQNIVTRLDAQPLGYGLFGLEELPGAPRVYQARLKNAGVVILRGQIIGGPHTSSLMEELAAIGVDTIVAQGIAGSTNPSIVVGDQVLCVRALNTDGTSKIYIGGQKEVVPDEAMAGLVKASAAELGVDIKKASAATVDAFYQETFQMIAGWQAQGADILNMEVTPLYAIAQYYRLKAIWLGYISDSIFGRPDFQYGNEIRRQSDAICLNTLDKLSAGMSA